MTLSSALNRRGFCLGAAALGASALVQPAHAAQPSVTAIVVYKSRRQLYLMHGPDIVKLYKIDLGNTPSGAKTRQGDGKTPEGLYHISGKNPQSRFHLSLRVSYPDRQDRARARRAGVSPGGDIYIHGMGQWRNYHGTDWTEGCIAVADKDIEDIFSRIRVGTPILIKP